MKDIKQQLEEILMIHFNYIKKDEKIFELYNVIYSRDILDDVFKITYITKGYPNLFLDFFINPLFIKNSLKKDIIKFLSLQLTQDFTEIERLLYDI